MAPNQLATAVQEREPAVPFNQPQSERTGWSISSRTKVRVKIALSVLMIASLFVFGKIDLGKTWEVATHANFWMLGLAAALLLITTFLNAQRWRLLASAVGFERPLLQLTKFCFAGLFFNLFLPSTVGGDFSRCYYLSKGTGRYHHAFYSIIADRVIGIAVLFAFAAFGVLLGPGGGQLPWQLKAPIFGGAAAIFLLVPFMPQLTRRLLGSENRIARRFNNSVVQVYWRDRGLIGVSLLLSVVMQIVMVLAHVCVGMAFSLDIPLWYYFIFYPSVAVLGFVTPSFNGVGIREWAYTYFLTSMAIDKAHALTYAIVWLGLNTSISLFGGLVYAFGHLKISKEEAQHVQYDTI
jgi:uncharacterized membrane protein YbhN (UPF0104 family)